MIFPPQASIPRTQNICREGSMLVPSRCKQDSQLGVIFYDDCVIHSISTSFVLYVELTIYNKYTRAPFYLHGFTLTSKHG